MRLLWVDTETGGLDIVKDAMLQLAALMTDASGTVIKEMSLEIKPYPGQVVGSFALGIQQRRHEQIMNFQIEEREACERFIEFVGGQPIIFCGYNCSFDLGFIGRMFARHGLTVPYVFSDQDKPLDVLEIARKVIPKTSIENHRLATVAAHLGLPTEGAHEALWDIQTTLKIWLILRERLPEGHSYRLLSVPR